MSEPGWLQNLRGEARNHFETLGLPTASLEDWRYTARALRPLAKLELGTWEASAPSQEPTPTPRNAADTGTYKVPESERTLFIDGCYTRPEEEDSSSDGTLRPLGRLITEQPDAERLQDTLGALAPIKQDAFAALNTARFVDGGYVHLTRNERLDRPLEIVFHTSGNASTPTFPRLAIRAETGSFATVVVEFLSAPGAGGFTNALTEIELADGAMLDLIVIQRESDATTHVSRTYVRQGANSHLRSTTLTFGGRAVRNDLEIALNGEGAETELDGLFLGTAQQHIDNHTVVDHAAAHCTSRERYKGILRDQARGVFCGRVLVRPNAQKTSAQQSNPNLLIGNGAEIDSKPQLEIHADDVRCSHGSTTGQLDQDAVFYLRTRGIGEDEARRILMEAFAAEVTEGIRLASLREALGTMLTRHLLEAGTPDA